MRTTTSRPRLVESLVLGGALTLLGTCVPASAQTTIDTIVLRSGLHSYYAGHGARVTVTEVGRRVASSQVTIVLRDAADVVVARTSGVLQRAVPVTLDFRVRGDERSLTQLRAVVTIVTETGGGAEPVTVLEDLDPLSLSVEPKVLCGPPSGSEGRQTAAMCDGWVVTVVTSLATP
jgi:hypothetical protein